MVMLPNQLGALVFALSIMSALFWPAARVALLAVRCAGKPAMDSSMGSLKLSRLNAITFIGKTWPRRRKPVGMGTGWFAIASAPSGMATRRKSGTSLWMDRRYRLSALPRL